MRITHALRCTAILATSAAGVAFWGTNLFFSQAEYDAYRADSRVLAADKARAVLATQAVLQSLGFSNAASTSNPPPTVTGKDGTLQYAPHNGLTYSSTFTNAAWVKTNLTVTANAAPAPDGSLTATLLSPTGNANIYQAVIAGAGAPPYTFSIWLKTASGGTLTLPLWVNGSGVTPNPTAQSITVTGAWQRFSIPLASVASQTLNPGIGSYSSAWTTGGDVHAWGAQLNLGVLTDYVPTTSAAAYGLPITYDRGASSNLLAYSEDLTNAVWTKANVTATATKFVESAVSSVHNIAQAGVVASGQPVYLAATCTAAERAYVAVYDGTLNKGQFFDLSAGKVLGALVAAPDSAGITPLGGGAYRCWIKVTPASTASTLQVYLSPDGSTFNYAGVAGSGAFVTALSIGANPFAYLKTGATAPLYTAGTPRSQNLLPYSDSLTGNGATATNCTNTATTVTIGATAGGAQCAVLMPAGSVLGRTTYTIAYRLSGPAGRKIAVRIFDAASGAVVVYVTHTLSATPTTYSQIYTPDSGGNTRLHIDLENRNGIGLSPAPDCQTGDVITWDQIQVYEGTGTLAFTATTGTPYSEYPQYAEARFGAATRETLHPRDLTQAAWTKSGMTVAKTGTGLDGVANSCSVLTATAGGASAVVSQTVTSASANRMSSFYVRSLSAATVTGYIGYAGVTSTAFVATPQWQRIVLAGASLTNPQYAIWLANIGDSVAVDFFQGEQGTFATPPIWGTESAAQTRDATKIRPGASFINDTAQTTLVNCVPADVSAGILLGRAGSGQVVYLNSGHSKIYDSTNSAQAVADPVAGVPYRVATRYSSGGLGISSSGGAVQTASFDGSMGTSASTVGIGDDGSGGSGFSGYITRLAIRGTAANDADMQLAGTGGR